MAWLTGWNRRKPKMVNGSTAGAQANYQMQLTVHKGPGADTPTDIYLGDNVRNDFGDVRFTSSNGSSLLNYWIDPSTLISGTSATFWVQIDSIPIDPGTVTIYVYYDNSSQTTTSNATDTFLLFDDFSGDLSKWTIYQSTPGNVSIVGGTLKIMGDNSNYTTNGVTSIVNIPLGSIIEFDLSYTNGSIGVWGYSVAPLNAFDKGISFLGQYGAVLRRVRDGVAANLVSSTISDTFIPCKIILKPTQGYALYYNNILQEDDTTWANPNSANKAMFEQTHSAYPSYIDNVRVRKYASPEPTWSCSGGEEVATISWLSGWNRRKSKVVNGSTAGAQSNYQMKLTVHRETGTDTSTDVYLGANVRTDFGDVRFTNSDGSSLLNYWIESISGNIATFWIQIGSIPANPCTTTIYVYYDNSSQMSISSGTSTFDFFENFESYSVGNLNGQGGWSGTTYYQVSSANPHAGTKSAYATNNDGLAGGPDMYNSMTANKNFITTWYVYYSGGISVGIGSLYPYEGSTQITRIINDNSGQLYDNAGSLGYTMSTGRWYKFQLTVREDGTHDIKVFDGDTEVLSLSGRSNATSMTTGINRLYLYHDFRFNTGYMDDIIVRKYVSPEPTFGVSGTEEAEAVLWLSGWNRRKSITITGASSIQSDYQMRLTVNQSSGTDSPGIVYLGGNILDNFNDLRFTKSNGSSPLSYWIESIAGTSPNQTATVWIRFDTIPAGPGTYTFYIYYNNPSATPASSGINTFPDLFDDFLGTTIDGTKWTGYLTGASLAGGIMTFTPSGDASIRSITPFSTGKAIRIRNNIASGSWSAWGFQIEPYVSPYQVVMGYKDATYNSVTTRDAAEILINTNWTTGSYTTKEIDWDDTNSIIRWYEDNIEKTGSPYTVGTNIPGIPLVAVAARGMYAQIHYVDWVLIRKYISPEPTFSAVGTEETLALITAIDPMIITTSQTPCLYGTCTVTVTVTWQNQGGTTGSFVPSLTIDGTLFAPYPSEDLGPGASVIHAFDITNLAAGVRTICPSPN